MGGPPTAAGGGDAIVDVGQARARRESRRASWREKAHGGGAERGESRRGGGSEAMGGVNQRGKLNGISRLPCQALVEVQVRSRSAKGRKGSIARGSGLSGLRRGRDGGWGRASPSAILYREERGLGIKKKPKETRSTAQSLGRGRDDMLGKEAGGGWQKDARDYFSRG